MSNSLTCDANVQAGPETVVQCRALPVVGHVGRDTLNDDSDQCITQ